MSSPLGEVSKDARGFSVRYERHLNYPIQVVWEAITDPEKLRIWFTDIEMDFKPGGKMTIWFRDENKTASSAEILKIIPPTLFVYSWEGELAEWELFPKDENSCRLVFTYSNISEGYAKSVPAGWHMLLDQLETVLDGHQQPYEFGGKETPEGKAMEASYTKLIEEKFPEFKISK